MRTRAGRATPAPGVVVRRVAWMFVLGLLAFVSSSRGLDAQSQPRLEIEREDGSTYTVAVQLDRGYAAVSVAVLDDLGWTVTEEAGAVTVAAADELRVTMRPGSPFFRWDDVALQLTDPPYRAGSRTYVPLQFLTDFLPRRLPGLYEFVADGPRLRAGDIGLVGTEAALVRRPTTSAGSAAGSERGPSDAARDTGPSVYEGTRVVVIDPGHGGVDPGALGPDGIREKEVALAIGLRLARRLRSHPDLEVHLIRDDDSFVDLWERGLRATELKGERPGIFVSIHANSFPARRAARGFETYFLSDARTEHERRVSAIENAPLSMNPETLDDDEALADIDFILRDLKNYDHAHWSENLAALVQEELNDVHPGPDRGVKQAILAVLTNALMPSVLVEVGYLSNDSEGRLLGTESFHDGVSEALAQAVVRFFDRYPPGSEFGGDREGR